jgi:putative peptidoglycan lipid II flippase
MSPPGGPSTSTEETARDSMVIGVCTAVSRATGLIRVLAVGAVLGPTFLGNAFMVTNSLPNLIYFGFLAGSLFTSLIVPSLVNHIERNDPARAAHVSGGYLGIVWAVLAAVVPLAVLGLPPLLGAVWGHEQSAPISASQLRELFLLTLLTAPQAFLYAMVGSAMAAMNAHRRFALASVAPALENLGVIALLAVVGLLYGHPPAEPVGTGVLLLLGGGSTAAVGLHAALQWWGAYRSGVVLLPRRGWRDPEILRLIRRSAFSVLQAGLFATQILVVLVLAGRVAGGTVTLQVAFNFYYLPIALVGTPIALAALPRLSRFHRQGAAAEFSTEFSAAFALVLFLSVPAALALMTLAEPLAQVVAAGALRSDASVGMISASIVALAPGLVGQAAFTLALQAAYARGDSRMPLRSMTYQALLCLGLCPLALLAPPERLPQLLAATYAAGTIVGGSDLLRRISRANGLALKSLLRTFARILLGSSLMALAVWLVVRALAGTDLGAARGVITLLAGSTAGLTVYVLTQALLRSPELDRLQSAAMRHRVPVKSRPASRSAP